VNLADDLRAAEMLRNDPKNCAEHVTIVDLLRNDLGRVCKLGSIRVEQLMQVERYNTLHQMTSSISGTLDVHKAPSEVFKALFPSGSITGAPKRRTMEIIRELERNARGVYTGAIGWFGPDGDACFNVAIRTLFTKMDRFTLGVGGGITADSDSAEEYKECQLKASFLQKAELEFHLIETMRASTGSIPLLDGHLQRISSSAQYFQIPFDEHAIRAEIEKNLADHIDPELRVRLTLEQDGQWKLAVSAFTEVPWSGRVLLSTDKTTSYDVFLHHKTSNRQIYEAALKDAVKDGFDEVLFTNQDGFVTEGAITNIFLLLDGTLITPDVSCGVLPGVQRNHILSTVPNSQSCKVSLADLLAADRIWVCNALRGIRPVTSISDQHGKILWNMRHDFENIYDLSGVTRSEIHSKTGSSTG
jgi:para-aminobenzoate synthetase/4-amino-4-deoxychorismate lyase